MRLIDANAVEEITWQDPSYTYPLNVLMEVREKVRALPTIDAVPVIRCKDCKYCDGGIDEDGKPFLKCLSGRSYGGTNADDYCSWAERKEE